MMHKWISILSGLLVAQLALALVVNITDEDYASFQAQEQLLVFDRQAVDGLRISDAKHSLLLKYQEGQWLLPESGDLPTSQGSVEQLLDKLSSLKKGWPIATTSSAARRFKVDDELFERRLELLSDDQTLAQLYVGTSPGFRKVHVRPAGEDAVFAVLFNSWEANAKADDWIDKDILKLDEADITDVEMSGLILQREGDELKVRDLGDEQETNAQEARSLMSKLTSLRIQSLLGSEVKPEYRQDEPALEIKLALKDSVALNYRFSKPEDASYYVLKRSDLDHYFKVAEFTLKPIMETTREKLVQTKTDDPPGMSAEQMTQAEATIDSTD